MSWLFERQMTCIKWLLIHDSNAHEIIDEKFVVPGVAISDYAVNCPTAFQFLLLQLFIMCCEILDGSELDGEEKAHLARMATYTSIFNGYESVGQYMQVSFRIGDAYDCIGVYSINTAWFYKAIGTVITSEPITLLSSLTKSLSTHASIVGICQTRGRWLTREQILKIAKTKLDELVLSTLTLTDIIRPPDIFNGCIAVVESICEAEEEDMNETSESDSTVSQTSRPIQD
ncbi:hypothetical protein F4811DRAFT_349565 [Daldinia bambusicola]|nr:hypothetical protein F4811DRAFT_349565 [Daldinia bambusicola]